MQGAAFDRFIPIEPRRRCWLLAGALVLLAWAAYQNSFSTPFLFDDHASIESNPTIKHLSALGKVLRPPAIGSGVTGRPVVNLSLALNYAWGGTSERGYHWVNFGLHAMAGLLLFGLVRRTLQQPLLHTQFGPSAVPLAWLIAALWTLHPLQTESVTCVIQRTELLVGLFYLGTLYCFVRSTASSGFTLWSVAAVGSCLLGMASKEVMVSAPLLVLLYDRTFVSGTFHAAWQKHRTLHVGLAATWLLLAWLVLSNGGTRGSVAGLGLGVSPFGYALKQCEAILRYLWLTFWPHPLLVDYGESLVVAPVVLAVAIAILLTVLIATAVALKRWPAAGFLGLWFFAILAPSSSIVPLLTQTVAEHRMYLPLAAVLSFTVLGLHAAARSRAHGALAVVVVVFGLISARRNYDYRSGLAIWTDTVAKSPHNSRAHHNLGVEFTRLPGHSAEAIACFERSLECKSTDMMAHFSLAHELALDPAKRDLAIGHYEAAIRITPTYANAHTNLANLLASDPARAAEALTQYEIALRLEPDSSLAHNNVASAYVEMPGRLPDAIAHFEQALRLKPDDPELHYNLAQALRKLPAQHDLMLAHYRQAILLRPDFPEAQLRLANELANLPGGMAESIPHYEAALRSNPANTQAEFNLGVVCANLGRSADAIRHFQAVLQRDPSNREARENLALLQTGK